MTTKSIELFFRQRVLNNLFPCEEGLNSDSEDDTKGLATESAMLQDVSSKGQKGQKRKRSDEEEYASSNIDLHLKGEKSTSLYHVQPEFTEKGILDNASASSREEKQRTPKETTNSNFAQERIKNSRPVSGSQSTSASERESKLEPKLSKNQKRKMKKKRHKERLNNEKRANPVPQEFTYETG